MYNALEKLRARRAGAPTAGQTNPATGAVATQRATGAVALQLTDKERDIHDRSLVSILEQLHDDFDAAVFAAYGWPDTLTDAEILTRLVALNAERAAEEKRGIIHWLRPEYQNKPGKDTTIQDKLDLPEKKAAKVKGGKWEDSSFVIRHSSLKTPWPKPLADHILATEQALHAAKTPVTAADLTKQFSRAKPHDIQEILESLVTLGRSRMEGEMFSV